MHTSQDISFGFSFELQTQVLIAFQNQYINEEETKTLKNKITEFQKMISGFINRPDGNLAS